MKTKTILATISTTEYPKGQIEIAHNKALGILQVILVTERAPVVKQGA